MCEEVAGLFVLALLKEVIAFEERDGFHFSEEMEQEFFGEVAKDRQGRFGECCGEFDAFEVADQLKSECDLGRGRGRDLEREGGELRIPRGGVVGRRGKKVREDGLEDTALLLVVEVEASEQKAVKELAASSGKKSDGFPSCVGLGVGLGLEEGGKGSTIIERGGVFGDGMDGFGERGRKCFEIGRWHGVARKVEGETTQERVMLVREGIA